ncbi:hypothetical protein HID58_004820 [Brassica napus]|uniref:Uncharacterized protein n=1 Tax=Brassica napus TaxID=3708 RepID=A0ABQ8E6X4_BRANA|nr:hypothetical protein HID58_004820 [Brassica napus]
MRKRNTCRNPHSEEHVSPGRHILTVTPRRARVMTKAPSLHRHATFVAAITGHPPEGTSTSVGVRETTRPNSTIEAKPMKLKISNHRSTLQ